MGTIIAVTAAAGMGGTGLGGLAAYLFRRGTDRTVSVLLSFAAGMMLAVVCADLLTDAIQAGPGLSALPAASASVLAGCGGIWLLEELVSGLQAGAKRGGLFLAGVVMAAAIALHNLPEGMVIGASYAADLAEAGEDGRMMALVIGLHNIPEGMAVAVPLAAGGAILGVTASCLVSAVYLYSCLRKSYRQLPETGCSRAIVGDSVSNMKI